MQSALENLKEATEFVNPTMPQHLIIVGREQLREALSHIAALEAELAATRCPIGLDATPDICSAGTCVKCAGALRERNAALEAENAELRAQRDAFIPTFQEIDRRSVALNKRVAEAETALCRAKSLVLQRASNRTDVQHWNRAFIDTIDAYFASAAQPKDSAHD